MTGDRIEGVVPFSQWFSVLLVLPRWTAFSAAHGARKQCPPVVPLWFHFGRAPHFFFNELLIQNSFTAKEIFEHYKWFSRARNLRFPPYLKMCTIFRDPANSLSPSG